MPNRPIIQYDENMNEIARFPSQKEAIKVTGIADYKMQRSRKTNKPVEGYFFLFESELLPEKIEATCTNCGKSFMCQRFRIKKYNHVFCCKECEKEYKRNKSPLNCTCEICGKKFHRKQSWIDKNEHQYCSSKCHFEANKVLYCGAGNHQYGLKGSKNSSWKSDERISYYGYRLIRKLDHPFRNCDNFVFEHRLIAEQYLLTDENSVVIDGERYLSPNFQVHHVDFDRLNNDPTNLYVLTKSLHMKFHNSLNKAIKDETNGRIIHVEKGTYSKDELREKFFDFLKSA